MEFTPKGSVSSKQKVQAQDFIDSIIISDKSKDHITQFASKDQFK